MLISKSRMQKNAPEDIKKILTSPKKSKTVTLKFFISSNFLYL